MLSNLFQEVSEAYKLNPISSEETIGDINVREELAKGLITLIATAHKLGVSPEELEQLTIEMIKRETKEEILPLPEKPKQNQDKFHLAVVSLLLKLFKS